MVVVYFQGIAWSASSDRVGRPGPLATGVIAAFSMQWVRPWRYGSAAVPTSAILNSLNVRLKDLSKRRIILFGRYSRETIKSVNFLLAYVS